MEKKAKRKLLLAPISRAAPGPLYRQIVERVKREVSEGRMEPGTTLPSFRGLAEDLLVSLITVKRAYEELERDGIIDFCTSNAINQKPERRAMERDEQAIERWKRKDWPRIKKNATRLGAHIVFIDESGFLLIPNVRKTWSPRGRTPIHPPSLPARQNLGHLWGIGKPKAKTSWVTVQAS